MSQNGDLFKETTIDEWMIWQNDGHVYKMKSSKYKIDIQENFDQEDESFEKLNISINILIKRFEFSLQ